MSMCETGNEHVCTYICVPVHVYVHAPTPRRALGTELVNLCDTWNQAPSTSFVVRHL